MPLARLAAVKAPSAPMLGAQSAIGQEMFKSTYNFRQPGRHCKPYLAPNNAAAFPSVGKEEVQDSYKYIELSKEVGKQSYELRTNRNVRFYITQQYT